MKTLFNDGSTVPTAFVTKGRQRVKQYNNNTVYLNNGDEFEIELFNPTTDKVLAKIDLDGHSIGSGIVLRPGERVFLERYMNESRKFLFETYEVDGNNPNVEKAIANNGKVDVKFYTEYRIYNWCDSISYTVSWPPNNPSITYTANGTGQAPQQKFCGQSGDAITSNISQASNLANDSVNCFYSMSAPIQEKKIETGRVEKGSHSNQSFTYDNTSFNSWWSWQSEWKIIPASQKPLEMRDLKVFCSNCGMKQRKQSDKFCPKCGQKY